MDMLELFIMMGCIIKGSIKTRKNMVGENMFTMMVELKMEIGKMDNF